MKGSIGTSMQSVICIRKKRGNTHCNECEHFKCGGGLGSPYFCSIKNKPRHYTSVVVCNKFKKKKQSQKEIDKWSKYNH